MKIRTLWSFCAVLLAGNVLALAQGPLKPVTPEERAFAARLIAMPLAEAKAAVAAAPDAQITSGLGFAVKEEGNKLPEHGARNPMEIYDLGLVIADRVHDVRLQVFLWSNKGFVAHRNGESEKAVELYDHAVKSSHNAGLTPDELGMTYGGRATARKALGDPDGAAEDNKAALAFFEQAGDQVGMARTLNNLGTLEVLTGQDDAARAHFEEGLRLARAQKQRLGEALLLNNIGNIYTRQGAFEQARDYALQALKIKEEVGSKADLITTLSLLADIYQHAHNEVLATQTMERAVRLARETGEAPKLGRALAHWGDMEADRGHQELGLAKLREALALVESEKFLAAEILYRMAEVEESLGQYENAKRDALLALEMAKHTGDDMSVMAGSLALSAAQRGLGDVEGARRSLEEAANAAERLRTSAAGGAQGRADFFSHQSEIFESLTTIDIESHRNEDAFLTSERQKARMLLDLMTAGRSRLSQELTAPERAEEIHLRARLSALESRRISAASNESANAALNGQLDAARAAIADFREHMYAVHPDLSRRRGDAHVVTLAQAARVLHGRSGLILEYEVTEDATYLFAISQGASGPLLHTYTLPVSAKELQTRVERLLAQLSKRDPGFGESASALYRLLLAPARSDLAGKQSVILVPSGPLWRLPFQALRPTSDSYVAEKYAISYAPSITTLRTITGQKTAERATHVLFAMANPQGDLPEAEREVREVQGFYSAPTTRVVLGEAASRPSFMTNAPQFAMLHVATHGAFDDRNPMYSHLLLAKGGDSQKVVELDASEIAEMNLKAKLVVLSGCETAAGKVLAGEGLIGLSWSFLAAGSRATLASQWRTESSSATMLMIELHRGLQQHMDTATALQRAQRIVAHDPRYSHPFYWAGFVLVGAN